jgi:hypothetical protein
MSDQGKGIGDKGEGMMAREKTIREAPLFPDR